MASQNENKSFFLRDWCDCIKLTEKNTQERNNAVATRVDDYSRSKTSLFLEKQEGFFENAATKLFEKAADAIMPNGEPKSDFQASPKAQKAMERALNAKIYDKSESKMKKIFAATMNVADKLGITQVGGLSVKDIADGADMAFSGMKTAFQVGNGMLTGQEASEIMTEHWAARVGKTVEMAIRGAGEAANAWVAAHFTPVAAAVTRPIVNAATKVVGSKVGQVVAKGVQKVAEYAKPVVEKVKEKGKEYAKKTYEKVSNFASGVINGIASFFSF